MNLTKQLTALHADNPLFEDKTPTDWLCEVSALTWYLKKQPEQNWLLFEHDVQHFATFLFALLCAQKHVILPPSEQSGQLLAIKPNVDATLGHAQIEDIRHISTAAALAIPIGGPGSALLIDNAQTIDFYTSGSTGESKKITKSWAQLGNEISDLDAFRGEQINNTLIVSTVSHQHIYGFLFKLMWPLLCGRQIFKKIISYPEELVMQLQQPVTLISSPAFLARTCQEPLWQAYANNISTVFSSGGPLNLATATAITQQLGHCPIEVLGSTETGGIAWRQQTQIDGHLWQSFITVNIRIEEQSQRLQIQSPYLSNEDGEENGWYTTDDRAQLQDCGRFELLSRADRMVKIEQKRLSLDALETQLNQHPWVEKCRALVIDGPRSQVAIAAVLTSEGKVVHGEQGKRHINTTFRHALSKHFEPVLLPRKWRYIDTLPVNSQGKLLNQQITELFQ
jgi:acyl-coenzyme A synthetase/AMP-(fatty) acid ligase